MGTQSLRDAELSRQQALTEQRIDSGLDRLRDVSWPILRVSADRCPETKKRLGFWTNRTKYDSFDLARSAILDSDISEIPTIVIVAKDSPADQADLRVGDQLVAIGGHQTAGNWNFRNQVERTVEKWPAEGEGLQVVVTRDSDARIITTNIAPQSVCDVGIRIIDEDSINAFTDGKDIVFTLGMIRFVESDWELQWVFAHELAHIIEGHVSKIERDAQVGEFIDDLIGDYTGRRTDMFKYVAALAFRQDYETEADYVAMYIMANAGLDTSAVTDFARRLSAVQPLSRYRLPSFYPKTHPSEDIRLTNIELTHLEIQEKLRKALPLIPDNY